MSGPTTTPEAGSSASWSTFLTVWSGQTVSIVGSRMTDFALRVWLFQETGSATLLALSSLANLVPQLLFGPLAGSLADRWDRRWVMILSDSVAALRTVGAAILLLSGQLGVWHVYFAVFLGSAAGILQRPAYAAATALLVEKRHLGRANGLISGTQSTGMVLSPTLAGILMAFQGLGWVLLIDGITFAVALATLLTVRFPRPPASSEGDSSRQGGLREDFLVGWRYVRERSGLLALSLFFLLYNLSFGMVTSLVIPMILSSASEEILGLVLSTGGFGMLAGSLVMSAWGGPRRRIVGVLGMAMLSGLSHVLLGATPSPILAGTALFLHYFGFPIMTGCSQVLWQSKVPPDLHGRVFAIRWLIGWSSLPLAYVIAGPLADHLFEPLMVEGGALAASAGALFGTGPGRGIGLMFVILGSLTFTTAAAAFAVPRLRRIQEELPDRLPD